MYSIHKYNFKKYFHDRFSNLIFLFSFGDGMAECAASGTEDLMVGSSIPAVAQGYLIFPTRKDERH